jgi:hypothetical protein
MPEDPLSAPTAAATHTVSVTRNLDKLADENRALMARDKWFATKWFTCNPSLTRICVFSEP